jgi:molybdopterin-guanine dinucleotide biosynthesis protein A
MSNTLKSIAAKHPELEDLETGVTTIVSGIHHVLERIANVAEQTAVVISGDMPVMANKESADAEKR